MSTPERIPFNEAFSEPSLLGAWWTQLSLTQQTILSAIYGQPLPPGECPQLGVDSRTLWSALQGAGEYDDLGFLTGLTHEVPYWPQSRREAWVIGGRRLGKALALDTPLLTTKGWSTMGAIKVGDTLYDQFGAPTWVTFVTDVQEGRPCYRVIFGDGQSLVADAEHQWVVWDKPYRKSLGRCQNRLKASTGPRVVTTQALRDEGLVYQWNRQGRPEYRFHVPVAKPIQHPTASLPIDPYILGVWLGDGHTHGAKISTADAEILRAVEDDYTIRHYSNYDYGIVGGLRGQLRKLGLFRNKHVPEAYLRASTDQRWALLQGLMDTDGFAPKASGSAEFYNTNPRIVQGVEELLAGLGCRFRTREYRARLNGRDCGPAWRIWFRAPRNPFRLTRKAERYREWHGAHSRAVIAIEPVESVPVRCIQVDSPTRTFLAGRALIPTHNTDRLGSTLVVYEALLGGHERMIRPGQRALVFLIAQDLRMARNALHFVRATLDSSPLLRKEVDAITADRIDLKNGFTIACIPPSLRAVRGYASPAAVLDEVGSWYQDADASNPDVEIYRALAPTQLQFPDAKIIGISSPWNKQGLLFRAWEAGTDGHKLSTEARRKEFEGVLVAHCPTALSGNPHVTREFLSREAARDALAFAREYRAEFQDSISGFLPGVLVSRAALDAPTERPPQAGMRYVAAIDPAFKRDAFGFTIVHLDEKGKVVQDLVRRWIGESGRPLEPAVVLSEIAPIAAAYGLRVIYSDQYHFESLSQLARQHALELMAVTFTSKSKAQIFGNLQQLFYQDRIRLLDHHETQKELRQLERRVSDGGSIQISAPAGLHDDMAAVLAIAASQVMNTRPRMPDVKSTPTHDQVIRDRIAAQIARKHAGTEQVMWD